MTLESGVGLVNLTAKAIVDGVQDIYRFFHLRLPERELFRFQSRHVEGRIFHVDRVFLEHIELQFLDARMKHNSLFAVFRNNNRPRSASITMLNRNNHDSTTCQLSTILRVASSRGSSTVRKYINWKFLNIILPRPELGLLPLFVFRSRRVQRHINICRDAISSS